METDKKEGKIIVVDDEAAILNLLSDFLKSSGYKVDAFIDSKDALFALKNNGYHILVADLVMPKIDGLQLVNYVKNEYLDTLAIIMTGYGTLETVISALRSGVFDYTLKPFKLEDILHTVESGITYYRMLKNPYISKGLKNRENLLKRYSDTETARNHLILEGIYRDRHGEKIVGTSLQMQRIFDIVERVSTSPATVLITGESGVGKELIAKIIHQNSKRQGPLVVINCGAIPETLLESELFGYEKGAFTGAITTKAGRFEVADKGTIFLDEIGDMSVALQVKLLRFLQEKTFDRVGGIKSITVDVRVIAATNRNLENLVKEGKFREDLYYRLNVVPISIPPLRERKQDIPFLLDYFLERLNTINQTDIEGFTEEAMEVLMNYHFPGNVRELQNIVERLLVLKRKGVIGIEDLPDKLFAPSAILTGSDMVKDYDTTVTEFEKGLILRALAKASGVKSKAAKILSINRTTLIEKMKKFGI